VETIWQDVRYAARTLVKSLAFSVVAVLMLALGIGANTAIFSVLYGVLLRPLPYNESGRIVQLAEIDVHKGIYDEMDVTYPELEYLEQHHAPFEALAGTAGVGLTVIAGNQAEHVSALRVSPEYFRVFAASPLVGRTFIPEDDRETGVNVAVLSHGLWVRQFGGDPGVVGRTAILDGAPYAIIGVMPADFAAIPPVDVWTTLAPVAHTVGSGENIAVVGRLARGVELQQASAAIETTNEEFRRLFPYTLGKESGLTLFPMQDIVMHDVKTPILVLFGAVGLVLLIACANVANMMLGRAAARSREMAVRAALGASSGRLIRQLLTESALVGLTAGVLGTVLAAWGVAGLLSLAPAGMLHSAEIHLDVRALGFTLGISLLTGLLFGLAPAFESSRADLNVPLKEAAGRTASGARGERLRDALVTGEVALSLILLVGAALLLQTFRNLMTNTLGFDPRRVLSAEIWLSGTRYDTTEKMDAYCRELTARLNAQPGVGAAAVVEAGLPLERGGNNGIEFDGKALQAAVDYRSVTPEYFRTLGVTLQAGRGLSEADGTGGAPVAVVNASFARRFASGDALGHAVTVDGNYGPRTVVGVVGDVKSFVGLPAPPTVFIPVAQTPYRLFRVFEGWFPTHVLVRTEGNPLALGTTVERTLRQVDSQVPVGRVRSMEQVLSGSLALEQFLMVLVSVFAGMAIALAMIGVYGVMSYLVSQRTREIGIRLALGARPADIWRRVLGRGMALVGAGALAGVAGALALARLLDQLLFGVRANDPLLLAGMVVALAAAAALACAIPASRASRVDPIAALRYE
jgi:predicted permease